MYAQLKLFFETVNVVKPRSSRNSSLEAFILCQNYQPPKDYLPSMINPLLLNVDYSKKPNETVSKTGSNSIIVPFLACGDLSGFDSDQIYELPEDHQVVEPIQTPINPPYNFALELRKKNQLDINKN